MDIDSKEKLAHMVGYFNGELFNAKPLDEAPQRIKDAFNNGVKKKEDWNEKLGILSKGG